MNYMRPDPTKETSCKECIFAKYDGKTQIGCLADRIEKFKDYLIEAYDEDKEFYVIKRFCNLFRFSSWNGGNADVEKAKKETCTTFDILINCNDINEEYKNKILYELKNLNYESKKIKVVFYHLYTLPKEQKRIIKDLLIDHPNYTISVVLDEKEFLQLYAQNSGNCFHIIFDQNNIDNISNFINKVNYLINEDMQKFVICRNDKKLAISNMMCRLIYTDLYINYDTNIKSVEENIKNNNLYVEF